MVYGTAWICLLLMSSFYKFQVVESRSMSSWVSQENTYEANGFNSGYVNLMTQLNSILGPSIGSAEDPLEEAEMSSELFPEQLDNDNSYLQPGLLTGQLIPINRAKWSQLLSKLTHRSSPPMPIESFTDIKIPVKRFYYWNNGKKSGN